MKILLADDERIARTMWAHWLTTWGYQVTAVADGEAAWEALQRDPEIRLAIMDWIMPKLDGPELCRRIRSGPKEPYIYVVLLTAMDSPEHIVQGLEAGADDYLAKPCNPLELRVRLRAGRRVVELQEELIKAREALRFEATHDSLTGLMSRGALLAQLERELTRAARTCHPVSVVLGDLDHFKSINDTFGHAAGDAVLLETARRLTRAVRAYDVVGRIGGEEFLVVLPDCDQRLGMVVAERLRSHIRSDQFPIESGSTPVTISLGVASTDQSGGCNAPELVRAADAALYRAKSAGRDQSKLAVEQDWSGRRSSPPSIDAEKPEPETISAVS
jgi:diguanylate cyclase (GGDEF)-like protein